jgi:phospholipase/carboxylesterase
MMREWSFEAAGLNATCVGDVASALASVVLLHGYAMTPEDLAPFARSLKLPLVFCFPRGPVDLKDGRSAWWSVDDERRSREIAQGARDLYLESPATRPELRNQLGAFITSFKQSIETPSLAIGGFSQGGMMSCDAVLHGLQVDGLILLSSSRIAFPEWQSVSSSLTDLPVFISHGKADVDLAFAAGTELKDFLVDSGAKVTWVPFEGGHEIPLVVWRALRGFLRSLWALG